MTDEQSAQMMKAVHNFCEYLSSKGIPPAEIVNGFTAAAIAILVDTQGRAAAEHFFLNLAADVKHQPDEENAEARTAGEHEADLANFRAMFYYFRAKWGLKLTALRFLTAASMCLRDYNGSEHCVTELLREAERIDKGDFEP